MKPSEEIRAMAIEMDKRIHGIKNPIIPTDSALIQAIIVHLDMNAPKQNGRKSPDA